MPAESDVGRTGEESGERPYTSLNVSPLSMIQASDDTIPTRTDATIPCLVVRFQKSSITSAGKLADAATLNALRSCRRLWVVWMNADDRVVDWLPGLHVEQAGRPTASLWVGGPAARRRGSAPRSFSSYTRRGSP